MSAATNRRSEADRELLELLWDLCEERLTEESADRLNDLLLADPHHRRTLIQFMQIAAGLEWEHSGLVGRSPEAESRAPHGQALGGLGVIELPSAMTGRGEQSAFASRLGEHVCGGQNLPHRKVFWRPLQPVVNWMQLDRIVSVSRAAALMLLTGTLCFGLLLAAVFTIAVMSPPAQTEHVSLPVFVAKLTGAHEVRWADGATTFMIDQLLAEDQAVEILSGWAEITFKSGARVVLEGPAKLEVHSAGAARLLQGKLAIDELARKVGFTLDTPTGRIVDMGAEFGVVVESDRTMELDVFAGAVEVSPLHSVSEVGGPTERVTANQAIRMVSESANRHETVVTRLTTRSNHFVRTLRTKGYVLGSACIARVERDMATGTVCFVRDPTRKSGRATSFSFYNVHADVDRWITPIILAFDRSTGTYRITGIGQSVLNLGSGVQTAPFQLIAGSGELQASVHTFGFYHGTIDKTGTSTSASLGPLDYDEVHEPVDPASPLAAETRWLFVPGEATPVELRLGLEFNAAPTPGQVLLWSGNARFSKERVYSGRLKIVAEPEFPRTVPGGDLIVQSIR